MAQTRWMGSLAKARTDQKRRGFRPTELYSLPCGTGFSAPYVDPHGQIVVPETLRRARYGRRRKSARPFVGSRLLTALAVQNVFAVQPAVAPAASNHQGNPRGPP